MEGGAKLHPGSSEFAEGGAGGESWGISGGEKVSGIPALAVREAGVWTSWMGRHTGKASGDLGSNNWQAMEWTAMFLIDSLLTCWHWPCRNKLGHSKLSVGSSAFLPRRSQ